MRGRRPVALVAGALVALHFLLHLGLGIGSAAPDLLIVALLLAAREVGIGTAAGLGLALGMLEDALGVVTFGVHSVSLTLVGMAGATTRDLFVGDSVVFLVVYFLAGEFARDLLAWVLMGPALREPFVAQVLFRGLVDGVYAAVVGVVLLGVTGLWREGLR